MVLLEYLQRTLVQLISITPVPTKEMLAGVPALRSGSPFLQVDAILPLLAIPVLAC